MIFANDDWKRKQTLLGSNLYGIESSLQSITLKRISFPFPFLKV